MNIGDAAQASEVSSKAIRYYENAGLIPPALRTAGRYRSYTPDVLMLRFINRVRSGFLDRADTAVPSRVWLELKVA